MNKLYENIGGKIKSFAKASFVVEAIGAIITGLVLLVDTEEVIYLLVLLGGPIVAWVSSWLLYGFGEIIDRLCAIDRNTEVLYQEAAKRKIEEARAEHEAALQAQREAQLLAQKRKEEREARAAAAREMRQAEEAAQQKAEAGDATVPAAVEKTLEEKLNYALKYQTTDGMIKYLQGIDDDTVRNILKNPASSVRTAVQQALENL